MRSLKHPATIVAALALFVALGGGAAAYATGLISGSQIKNHSISANKLTKKAIKQLKGTRGPRGAKGATGLVGPAGAQGVQGPAGPSNAFSIFTNEHAKGGGGVHITASAPPNIVVTSLALGPGSYVVMGNMNIYNYTAAENTYCELVDSKTGFLDDNYAHQDAANTAGNALSLLAPLTTTGSTVDIDCNSTDSNTWAYNTHLVAIKLGSLSSALGHESTKAPSTQAR